ncbi:MAG: response regulator transcription factor [Bacteroidota bacterium]
MKNIKLLLAEDDQNLGMLLKEYLFARGINTDLFSDGEKALHAFRKNPYDICILDVMMPFKDGFSLARDIRLLNSDIPIIFLTAKSLKEDVFEGFKAGADDYITKPFSMEELLLRIEAVLRRAKKENLDSDQIVYTLGKFTFDSRKQLLKIENKIIKLTTKESELLKLLANNANKILDRNQTLKAVWSDDSYYNARSMDVYITKLRKKLQEDPAVEIINIHGKGFKLII